jgi:hypothetical protein
MPFRFADGRDDCEPQLLADILNLNVFNGQQLADFCDILLKFTMAPEVGADFQPNGLACGTANVEHAACFRVIQSTDVMSLVGQFAETHGISNAKVLKVVPFIDQRL